MANKNRPIKSRRNPENPFKIRSGRFSFSKLDKVSRSEWAEDVYISDNTEKETIGRNFEQKKLYRLIFVFSLFLLILLGRTAWLQTVKGDYYHSVAEGNRIRIERVEPTRGIIYDRYFHPLVRNKANFMLYFIPADLPKDTLERKQLFDKIISITGGLSIDGLNKLLEPIVPYSPKSYQPLFVLDNIEYEKAMLLYLESYKMPGVILSNKTNREYLYTGLQYKLPNRKKNDYYMSLSHIIGYTGKISEKELTEFGEEYLPIDYIGKMGIESFWENELRGVNGKKQIEVDAFGKEKKIIKEEPAEDGHNLVLSLDTPLQLKTEEILQKHLYDENLSRGAVVILDPNNGEVLSLVSLPAYNNNVFARGISQEEFNFLINQKDHPLFNRAISGEYPSGSTIKPVIAAAALQEGVITEHTSFNSVGGLSIGKWFFPDWRAGGHGVTNVRKAIAQSVNTFFYYIGGGYDDFEGLGVDRIVIYAKLFGLGSQLGIDLAGEATGLVPTKQWKEETKNEPWYIGDTYHLAIGQGDILVTPLQVANFTAVFANGGKLYNPHLIRNILSGSDKPLAKIENKPIREDFIDLYNIDVVRQGMRKAVTEGSARRLSTLPVAVAGKTGTAQWSSKKEPHAWFTGFAPYLNPELAITVLVEEGGEGSSVAVPIAQDILNWYFGEYKKDNNEVN